MNETFYGIHWKRVNFLFILLFTVQCAFLMSYLTSPYKTWTSWRRCPRDKTACQTSPCKCKICISSIESDVYNKKKIQMFVVNMTLISSREVKNMYISFVPSALMKYTFFHFTRWNKSHIHSKHLNILYLLAEKVSCSAMFSKKEFAIVSNCGFISSKFRFVCMFRLGLLICRH